MSQIEPPRKVERSDLTPIRWQVFRGDYVSSVCFEEADANAILYQDALVKAVVELLDDYFNGSKYFEDSEARAERAQFALDLVRGKAD